MYKLQIRVDRTDAELMRDALEYLADHSPRSPRSDRAAALAKWLDHRITQYYGVRVPPGNTFVTQAKPGKTDGWQRTGKRPGQ